MLTGGNSERMVVPTAVTGLVMFALFVGGRLFLNEEFGVWWTLALVGTGTGAVGSAALLISRRSGVSSVRQRRLLAGTQLCLLSGSLMGTLSTFDHSGFRNLVLAVYAGVFLIGVIGLVAAIVGTERTLWPVGSER